MRGAWGRAGEGWLGGSRAGPGRACRDREGPAERGWRVPARGPLLSHTRTLPPRCCSARSKREVQAAGGGGDGAAAQQQPASKKQKSGAAGGAAAWKAGVGYGTRWARAAGPRWLAACCCFNACALRGACQQQTVQRPASSPCATHPCTHQPCLPPSLLPTHPPTLPRPRSRDGSGAVWDAKKSEAVQAAADRELRDVLAELAGQLAQCLSPSGTRERGAGVVPA